ncbi:MAG: hypothetical protein ACOY90_06450 [Candidatus Zhuqueibacterota bacterium]
MLKQFLASHEQIARMEKNIQPTLALVWGDEESTVVGLKTVEEIAEQKKPGFESETGLFY